MRKGAAAALALPILVVVYAATLVRRAAPVTAGRAVLVVILVGVVSALTAFGLEQARPPTTAAQPVTVESPLPAAAFRSEIRAGTAPNAKVTIAFGAPMSVSSVAAALTLDPETAVTLTWNADDTVLSVAPRVAWESGRYHTITIPAGTLQASGAPIPEAIRASFLIRSATIGTVAAIPGATPGSAPAAFRVSFDRPVLSWTVDLTVDPAIGGVLRPDYTAPSTAPAFLFVPTRPLAAGTTYAVSLAPGALDADGVRISASPLVVTTAPAPTVVRFRPAGGTKGVDPRQVLSVRFSQPMDEAATQAAWSATQGGAAIDGSFAWSENDSVLVFTPKAPLGYAQSIVMTVGTGARSKAGVALATAASATVTTAAKPAATPAPAPKPVAPPPPAGAGTGTWAAVEAYYLKLMNCTRTGGWVSTSGSCSGAGTRAVAPLWQDMGISANVSRPYAKHIVIDGACSHFDGSTPAQRLAAAGYTSYIWAENVGCGNGDPYAAMLADHLFFQAEASTNGGHYRNLMDAKYDRCGIGVWAYAGRVRLVVDFYHPL